MNQVLVRLWARCLEGYPRERVPSSQALAQAGVRGLRSLTGQGLVMGIHGWVQPSNRRHMCSEAFYGLAGCDAGGSVVCKLSFERCVLDVSSGVIREWMVPVHDGLDPPSSEQSGGCGSCALEHEKGIRWMPWHQEAMKDVARCEKPRGAASRR